MRCYEAFHSPFLLDYHKYKYKDEKVEKKKATKILSDEDSDK